MRDRVTGWTHRLGLPNGKSRHFKRGIDRTLSPSLRTFFALGVVDVGLSTGLIYDVTDQGQFCVIHAPR